MQIKYQFHKVRDIFSFISKRNLLSLAIFLFLNALFYKMNEEITPGYLQTVAIIHFMFMTGILMFAAIVYFLLIEPEAGNTNPAFYDIALVLAPTLAIAGYFLGNAVGKRTIIKTKNKDWETRLNAYQTTLIIKNAALEGSALFAIVCTLFTNKVEFLIIVVAVLFIMFMIRPTKDNIRRTLMK